MKCFGQVHCHLGCRFDGFDWCLGSFGVGRRHCVEMWKDEL